MYLLFFCLKVILSQMASSVFNYILTSRPQKRWCRPVECCNFMIGCGSYKMNWCQQFLLRPQAGVYRHLCQLSSFDARLTDFLDPFSNFSSKRHLATNQTSFSITLATFSRRMAVLPHERNFVFSLNMQTSIRLIQLTTHQLTFFLTDHFTSKYNKNVLEATAC